MFCAGVWILYKGAWPWSFCMVLQDQAPGCRRSSCGQPRHWAPLDREKSVVSAGERLVTSTPQQILARPTTHGFCCCRPAWWALAPCLGPERGDSARPCSRRACRLPPLEHLGGDIPNSAPAKRTVLLDKGRCKTSNTGAGSVAKSRVAGCAGCLGSYAEWYFLICSARCRHLNFCWKETEVPEASCDFAVRWFTRLPICGTATDIYV